MSALAKAAVAYARTLGWRVFPLVPRGKVPLGKLVPNGVLNASNDPDQVSAWWRAAPFANIGLACGFGWFVLDVDPRNFGDETLGELEQRNGELPTTPRQVTGGGGAHILFQIQDGAKLKGSLGPGIDVKGIGGYIVAAPSVHPSGAEYSWEALAHPVEVPIASAPDWVMRILEPKRTKAPSAATGNAATSFLARCFDVCGWLGEEVDNGRVMARCPWSVEHSADRTGRRTGEGEDTSCVIMAPTADRPLGVFHCAHGHCAGRGNTDALRALPTPAVRIVARQMPELFETALHLVARMAK